MHSRRLIFKSTRLVVRLPRTIRREYEQKNILTKNRTIQCWRYAVDVRTYAHAHHAFLKQFCAVGQSRRTHTHTHIDGWTVTTDTRALRSGLAWSTIMSFGKVQTSNGQRTVHERPLSVDFPVWVPRWISMDSAEISESPEVVRQCLTRIIRNFGRVPGNPTDNGQRCKI